MGFNYNEFALVGTLDNDILYINPEKIDGVHSRTNVELVFGRLATRYFHCIIASQSDLRDILTNLQSDDRKPIELDGCEEVGIMFQQVIFTFKGGVMYKFELPTFIAYLEHLFNISY